MTSPGPVFAYAPVTNNISNTTHQGAPSPRRSKLEQVYWVAGILGVIVAIVLATFTVLAYVRPPSQPRHRRQCAKKLGLLGTGQRRGQLLASSSLGRAWRRRDDFRCKLPRHGNQPAA